MSFLITKSSESKNKIFTLYYCIDRIIFCFNFFQSQHQAVILTTCMLTCVHCTLLFVIFFKYLAQMWIQMCAPVNHHKPQGNHSILFPLILLYYQTIIGQRQQNGNFQIPIQLSSWKMQLDKQVRPVSCIEVNKKKLCVAWYETLSNLLFGQRQVLAIFLYYAVN